MKEKTDKFKDIKNSDVIKHTLFSLVSVANSKTSKDYAWSIIKKLLVELKRDHAFLKYIHIDEIKNLDNTMDDINVLSDFDSVEPKRIGQAIQNIVNLFKIRMGKKAGYFFLTEFKKVLGKEYHSIIKEMGVDLRIIDLQKDITFNHKIVNLLDAHKKLDNTISQITNKLDMLLEDIDNKFELKGKCDGCPSFWRG